MMINSYVKLLRCFFHTVTTTVATKIIDNVTFFIGRRNKFHLEANQYTKMFLNKLSQKPGYFIRNFIRKTLKNIS